MKGKCYSLCKTAVFLNPKDNVIFVVSPLRVLDARFSTSKRLSNERAMQKIPCPANMPLSIPINERDISETHSNYHSEKQIARWFIKKSEYNESTF
ncbi:hypothetical protein ACIP9C_13930 [Lysinibacillus sp. NPDC093210]|uniref:hypothetical protein n=1 Tax=Lysinibacillus sp. NPDC093210 TaxID=3364133 RepID=UPI003810E404